MSNLAYLYKQDTMEVYAQSIRHDILALFDKPYARVLDVGCNTGVTGEMLLKRGLCSHVTGIELLAEPARQASLKLNRLIHAPVEAALDTIADERFDCILALDVLEHLVDPWIVARRLSKLLAPQGVLVTSIPNIRHWRILRDLIFKGQWKYVESGILDRTHLRFFTKSSILEMLESTGLEVEVNVERPTFGRSRFISRMTFGLFDGFLMGQYLTRCRHIPVAEAQ
jgi:2-polyprenyl-3-methyl-5-hydroxy-6-metoxy-1,4-benzoquinol methylase